MNVPLLMVPLLNVQIIIYQNLKNTMQIVEIEHLK